MEIVRRPQFPTVATSYRPCGVCDGHGYIWVEVIGGKSATCNVCGGRGYVRDDEREHWGHRRILL